ncbi:putative Na+/H+ antiporter [Bordetella sp. LUAb4]|uniref:putative Na+/H+ antiporter n=1 Tax=Bordetella sp. LUAb4 TaxID=2843195 RepID=UPI001E4FB8E8|nr:putative Na+/H+ antiporter [Bordetella sp. LUAb4]
MNYIAAALFAVALLHTFCAPLFLKAAHKNGRHSGLLHLLGEVEVVFGFWAAVLLIFMAIVGGGADALQYAETRNYTEPAFVFVVMVIAASLPVLTAVMRGVETIARWLPVPTATAKAWLCLSMVPLLGSLVTEPAAMTIAALMLAPQVFHKQMPERLKYIALGVLFVNISIGGTLTSYAAPPVLIVAHTWGWDTAFMLQHFGWKAALAVVVNGTLATLLLRAHLRSTDTLDGAAKVGQVSVTAIIVHLIFLAAVVVMAHHPIIFMGLFLFFIGYTQAYQKSQDRLIIREALLVGFFLAGLVVLGGMQQWWLQPIVSALEPKVLFFSATALTAITDNAALTYLGSLIEGISDQAKYMLVAGAVAGGGLTVIANAPNPAGVSLLRGNFRDESVSMGGLFLGALVPTCIAMAAFFLL